MANSVVDFPFDNAHVTTFVLVHAGRCVLHTIVANSILAGVTVSVLNGNDAGGTAIGVLTGSATWVPVTFVYDSEMSVGLYILVAGGVCDLTVTYK
jgi:hypothetical protein